MKTKLIIATSVAGSLMSLLKGQPRYLSKYYNITLISSPGKEIDKIRKYEKVPVKSFEMSRKITLIKDFLTLIRLTIYFNKSKPKIVHSYTPKAGLLVMFASFLSGVPHRFHSVVAMPLTEAKGLKKLLLILTERITYLFSTKLFCNSKILKKYMADNLTNRPITVIWNGSMNGIDSNYFKNTFSSNKLANIRKKMNITEQNFIILFVGRIVKDKGINELIEAFIKVEDIHPQARLFLIGDYEENLNPISIKNRNHIEKHNTIIKTGYKKDVREYLSIANLFILPSYREGLPNVLLEAGCYNIPLIASNINGCNEIIEDRQTGILIPSKDVEALTDAICELIENEYLNAYLSSNIRKIIEKKFSQKIFYKHLVHEYNKEINKHAQFKL